MLFVYDGNPGHEWQDLLGDHVALETRGDRLAGGSPRPGDVVVCHRVQSEAIGRQLRAFARAGVFVVEIGSDTAPEEPAEGNYYRRARGVSATDTHFRACFAHFAHRLAATGNPEWPLLEGPPAPDALLACHLLALLVDDPEARKARDELRQAALEEATTIVDSTGIPWDASQPSRAPERRDLDDIAKVRDFLVRSAPP